MTRSEGAIGTADALHSSRAAVGVLEADELPIRDYDELNVTEAVAAIKELTLPDDVRAIIAYEEAHKNRQRIVSAAQTRVAAIAKGSRRHQFVAQSERVPRSSRPGALRSKSGS